MLIWVEASHSRKLYSLKFTDIYHCAVGQYERCAKTHRLQQLVGKDHNELKSWYTSEEKDEGLPNSEGGFYRNDV